jgi:hypothetical protein
LTSYKFSLFIFLIPFYIFQIYGVFIKEVLQGCIKLVMINENENENESISAVYEACNGSDRSRPELGFGECEGVVYFASKYKSHELPSSLFCWKFLALQWEEEEEEEGGSVGVPLSSWCTLAFTATVSSASSAVVVSNPLMSSQLSRLLFLAFLPG